MNNKTTDNSLTEVDRLPIDTHGLTYLGYKILLDRYALKGDREKVNVGDIAVCLIVDSHSSMSQKRELGIVQSIQVINGARHVTCWIPAQEEYIVLPLERIDIPLETTPEQVQSRVAFGLSLAETTPDKQTLWQRKFEYALHDWKFVPGGRILAGAGSNIDISLLNCFVLPSPHDSRNGIMKTLTDMAEIMSRGGGVGINVSSLRPRHAYVKGVNGRSSGSVSWGALYSFVTGLIEQNGSRRGALMIILDDWHPDVFDFINSKRQAGQITNANISVNISDKFMDAVKNNDDWALRFPDTSHSAYNTEWDANLFEWESKGYPVITHKIVKARDIWNAIIESAWASAEPGVWFGERSNKLSNSSYFNWINCTNPCSEQSLPGYSSCNLGSINLSKLYNKNTNDVDWDELKNVTQIAVRFLDNVIDVTYYPLQENKEQQQNERRVGLGVMGLAEILIKCQKRYGSKEGNELVEKIYRTITETAYMASVEIAKEKGAFKFFIPDMYLNNGFVKQLPDDIKHAIASHGIRNVTLITQAPTGTGGTMMNTSTGIEPFFSWSYWRKGRLGMHEERVQIADTYFNEHPEETELPDYFVTAMNLSPKEHVEVQALAQRWNDSSISKTVNCPNNWTVEQVSDLYMLMYDLGCKGGTIYRDGSRDEQVLNLKKEDNTTTSSSDANKDATVVEQHPDTPKTPMVSKIVEQVSTNSLENPFNINSPMEKRPVSLNGKTLKTNTSWGTMFVNITESPDGQPFEVFVTIGKSGSDLQAFAEAIGRLLSMSLRSSTPNNRREILRAAVNQLRGIGGASPYGFGINRVASFPDAIAKLIEDEYIDKPSTATDISMKYIDAINTDTSIQKPITIVENDIVVLKKGAKSAKGMAKLKGADTCPECQNLTLVREEGCQKCNNCGYSRC